MNSDRAHYRPKTFVRTFEKGQAADLAGIGRIEFLEKSKVRFTVPEPMRITVEAAAERVPEGGSV